MSTFTYRGKSRTGGTTSMFISRWDTTQAGSANDTIILPFVADGDYDFYVDWGDGTRDNITTYNQAEVTHQYSNTGIYEVRIYGGITGWQFNNVGDKEKIIEISNWGPLSVIDRDIFDGCSNLELTTTDALDLSNVISLRESFRNCSSIGTQGNIGSWDVSNITRIRSCFNGCSNFDQDLSNWDVSNFGSGGNDETNSLFQGCTVFNNGGSDGISGWDVSNFIGSAGMNSMFQDTAFNRPIGVWNVSNVKSMTSMFQAANSFNQDIGDWDVSSVTSMNSMFQSNTAFNNGGQTGIYNWDVSSCTDFAEMFDNADNFNQDIGGWTLATGLDKSINCFRMFRNNGGFNNGGSPAISGWNTSRITSMSTMFQNATAFNQPIGTWDTSSVTNMNSMFYNQDTFDQDIGEWDTSQVVFMNNMFWGHLNFNNGGSSSISGWDVGNVTTFQNMFRGAGSFNQPIGSWDVSNCTNFYEMLHSANSFNQDLGDWVFSPNLTDLNHMFYLNTAFNNGGSPSISGWDVSNITSMQQTFFRCASFNQPIGAWDTRSLTNINTMFSNNCLAFDQDLSNWIVTGITSATNFMETTTALSTENYEKTLSGWAAQSADLQAGVSINFGGSVPNAAASGYKETLTGVGWTITDSVGTIP